MKPPDQLPDGPDPADDPPPLYIVIVNDDGTEEWVEFKVDESQGRGFEPVPDDFDLDGYLADLGFSGRADDATDDGDCDNPDP